MTEDTPEPADKPPLKDARQNPWYVLMTVAGEQPKGANWNKYDRDLHARNKRYFNGWMAAGLVDDAKARLIDSGWAKEDDFAEGGALAPPVTRRTRRYRSCMGQTLSHSAAASKLGFFSTAG